MYWRSSQLVLHPQSRREFSEARKDLFLPSYKSSLLKTLAKDNFQVNSPTSNTGSEVTKEVAKLENKEKDVPADKDFGKSGNVRRRWLVIKDSTCLQSHLSNSESSRIFMVQQDNSWSPLNITEDVFEQLCKGLKMCETLKHILRYSGARNNDEIAPPRPKWKFSSITTDCKILECCYALRYIALNHRSSNNPWSLRQFAVYNKSQAEDEPASWLLVSPPEGLISQIADSGTLFGNATVSNDLTLHMAMFAESLLCWRSYLFYLLEEVEKCNGKTAFAAPSKRIEGINLEDIRVRLKNLGDQVEEAKVSLRSNKEVIRTLQQPLVRMKDAKDMHQSDNPTMEMQLKDTMDDFDMLITQLETLENKILSCAEIASSFSELSNGLMLQKLAVASAEEARRASETAQQSQHDAAAVNALTVIASVFFPTTLVLNFFSASFIDISDNKMVFVNGWWIFLVVTVPLTLITIGSWVVWMRHKHHNLERKKQVQLLITSDPSQNV